MPRVKNRFDRRKDKTRDLIRNRMRQKKLSQEYFGNIFGKTRAAFSQNLKNLNLRYDEFLVLCEKLELTDEEKAEILTL